MCSLTELEITHQMLISWIVCQLIGTKLSSGRFVETSRAARLRLMPSCRCPCVLTWVCGSQSQPRGVGITSNLLHFGLIFSCPSPFIGWFRWVLSGSHAFLAQYFKGTDWGPGVFFSVWLYPKFMENKLKQCQFSLLIYSLGGWREHIILLVSSDINLFLKKQETKALYIPCALLLWPQL